MAVKRGCEVRSSLRNHGRGALSQGTSKWPRSCGSGWRTLGTATAGARTNRGTGLFRVPTGWPDEAPRKNARRLVTAPARLAQTGLEGVTVPGRPMARHSPRSCRLRSTPRAN